MRKELEHIERIEAYILGEMNESDRIIFEKEMSVDSSLRNDYNLQLQIMEAVERNAMLLSAANSFNRWQFLKTLKLTAAICGTLIVGVTSYFYFSNQENKFSDPEIKSEQVVALNDAKTEENVSVTDEVNETTEIINSEAFHTTSEVKSDNSVVVVSEKQNDSLVLRDVVMNIPPPVRDRKKSNYNFSVLNTSNLRKYSFKIDNNKDTVLQAGETQIRIYKNTFITNLKTESKTDIVDIDFIPALSMEDIVKGGLFTITKDFRSLESGGMFFLNASKMGVALGQRKRINIQWVNSPYQDGMKLFTSTEINVKIDSLPARIVWMNPSEIHQVEAENDPELNFSFWDRLRKIFRSEPKEKKQTETVVETDKLIPYNLSSENESKIFTQFSTSNQGWTDMSRYFLNEKFENSDFKIKVKNAKEFTTLSVSVAFKYRNVFLPAYRTPDNNFILSHHSDFPMKLPMNEKVVVLVTATKGDTTFFTFKHVMTSELVELELEAVPMPKSKIMEAIEEVF